MTRLLVTGSTGQLGRELVAVARAAGIEVAGLARTEPEPCDLTDAAAVQRRITGWAPDLVIHAGAATDVDACERKPGLAQRTNVEGTRHVVDAARAVGAHVVLLSTNHVFGEGSPRPHREQDPTTPRSAYARTKVEAEQLVGPDATIVRTSWLWGSGGRSLVRTVIEAASRPGPLAFADDERARPTLARDLAPVVVRLGTERRAGTWHAANSGDLSAYEVAREVLRACGDDPDRAVPVPIAQLALDRPAPRPRNAILDTTHLERDGGGGLPHHGPGLAALVAELLGEA